jgi:hypothetical protein
MRQRFQYGIAKRLAPAVPADCEKYKPTGFSNIYGIFICKRNLFIPVLFRAPCFVLSIQRFIEHVS